ncbi:MAG: anti-sigma factor family protein [Gammaproteobacteria bacterium]
MNREEAQKLLPWFAVGALDADEARAVEVHVENSPELQRELAEVRVLADAVGEVAPGEPAFRPALIDDALRQIDAYENAREARRPQPASPGLFGQAVNWLRETLVGGWVGSPAGARLAMVAQFALILILGGVLLMPPGPGDGEPAYVTSSAGNVGAGSTGGVTIGVVFQPTVTELQMRETLADVGGEIVAGPSRQGSYSIRIDAADADEVERVIERLRGQPDVIRFAAEAK